MTTTKDTAEHKECSAVKIRRFRCLLAVNSITLTTPSHVKLFFQTTARRRVSASSSDALFPRKSQCLKDTMPPSRQKTTAVEHLVTLVSMALNEVFHPFTPKFAPSIYPHEKVTAHRSGCKALLDRSKA